MFRPTLIGAAALVMALTALGCAYEEHDYYDECEPALGHRYEYREDRHHRHDHHRHDRHRHGHRGHGPGGYRY